MAKTPARFADELNKQIALLKKCPICKTGELQIRVDTAEEALTQASKLLEGVK